MTGTLVTLTPNPALDLWMETGSFETGTKLRCSNPKVDPGGGGLNVSRVVRRIGGETLALYAAGGRTGGALAEALAAEDVPFRCCEISRDTRQDIAVREVETGETLRFVTPGPVLNATEREDLLALLTENLPDGSIVVGSGSLPDGVGERFWAEVAVRCSEGGCRFILDSHDAVQPALREGLFCFRENRDAIERIAGREIDWPAGAADWAEEQVRAGAASVVVVTEGAEGAVLVDRDMRILQRPPDVERQSAIGAGDSFVAGFCLALSRNEDHRGALRMAVATAAAALLTEGTELCRAEDVERLLSEMGETDEV